MQGDEEICEKFMAVLEPPSVLPASHSTKPTSSVVPVGMIYNRGGSVACVASSMGRTFWRSWRDAFGTNALYAPRKTDAPVNPGPLHTMGCFGVPRDASSGGQVVGTAI
jgi:hypothetical protein